MATARKLSPVKKIDSRNNTENESTISGGYDPFKQSNLFHEVYLNVEVPHKFKDIWEPRDPKEFDHFCNAFRNLCAEYDFKDFDSWSEIDTIQNWIIPVLHMLGYYDKCEGTAKPFSLDTAFTYEKKSLRPDFIIVDRPSDLKRIKDSDNSPEQKLSEAREYVKLTIEAKYWDRLEEYKQNKVEDKKRADNKKANAHETKDPVEQALEYMKMLHNDWGILTDGKVWRLYHRELSSDSQKRCFQFNLGYLAKFAQEGLSSDSEEQKLFTENAKYFFYLFNKNALFGKEGKGKLLDHLIEYSKEYVHKIEEDLRTRFVQAMTTFCNGLHESMGKPKGEEKLDLIRNVAESHLFNIMFIKSCESRLILPMKSDYLGRSLTRMVQCLKRYKPERQFDDHNLEMLQCAFGNQNDENSFYFTWNGTELYDRLIDLTEFIQKGTNPKFKNFKIEGFTESVFTKQEWAAAQEFKISNKHIVSALFEIGYAKPDENINKYQQIPYNFFTARQLGSIYESFLEFKIDFAEQELAFIQKQWIAAKINSEKIQQLGVPVVTKGSLYFTPNNDQRKATGAYYTPDHIVQLIVEETLRPLVENKTPKEICKLKVCDPAMGSGHFINASLNYLAKKYLDSYEKENYLNISLSIQDAKREILHNCIFGLDINSRATKLTKMSLWLESAVAGRKLELLNDQIKTGDSLVSDLKNYEFSFDWEAELISQFGSGFDAIVGNPPYVSWYSKQARAISKNYENYLRTNFDFLKDAKGKVRLNSVMFFLEKSLKLLKNKGRLGLIIDTNIHDHPFLFIRKYISNICKIESVVNNLKVFEEVGSGQVILQIENATPKNNSVKFYSGLSRDSFQETEQSDIQQDPLFKWVAKENGDLLSKIEFKTVELGEITEIKTGVAVNATEEGKAQFLSDVKKNKNYYPLLIGGKSVTSSFCNPDTDTYLNYDKALEKKLNDLFDKEYFKKKGSHQRPFNIKDINEFNREKIIVRQSDSKLTSTLVKELAFCNFSLFNIYLKENSELDLRYVLGVLNSNVLTYYAIKSEIILLRPGKTPQIRSGSRGPKGLFQLPIKIATEKLSKSLINLVDKILAEKTESKKFDKIQELNKLVAEIYGLSDSDLKQIVATLNQAS